MKLKNMIMGLALGSVVGLTAVDVAGCKHIDWSPDTVYKTMYCAGCTGGAVVAAQKYPAEVTDASLEIADLVRSAIPNEWQTLTQVWTPIVEDYLAKTDKVPEGYKPLVKMTISVLTNAYDIERAKHPEIAQGEAYLRKGIDGLIDGYKFFVKPSCPNCGDPVTSKSVPVYTAPKIDYSLYQEIVVKCRLQQ